jgi:CRP-like cAMP-binding protein
MQFSSSVAIALESASHHPLEASPTNVEDIRLIGITMRYGRDQEIFGEGEGANHVYKVLCGAVRGFRVLADGRRQISEFYLPGDVFGFEAGLERRASAEALTDTTLVVARRAGLSGESDGEIERSLWRAAVAELRRSRDHVLTLGRRSASERVATFLVDLAERIGEGESVELPMSRQDIADYLGLTIETVSRTLTQFQVAGLIRLANCRDVHILRPQGLEELCD